MSLTLLPSLEGGGPRPSPTVLDIISVGLSGREFLVGGALTAADVVMASILHLANTLALLDGHPRLGEYVQRHSQRPAVRKAASG